MRTLHAFESVTLDGYFSARRHFLGARRFAHAENPQWGNTKVLQATCSTPRALKQAPGKG
jgi:hypothetical protein